jgi:hypothetical protein
VRIARAHVWRLLFSPRIAKYGGNDEAIAVGNGRDVTSDAAVWANTVWLMLSSVSAEKPPYLRARTRRVRQTPANMHREEQR